MNAIVKQVQTFHFITTPKCVSKTLFYWRLVAHNGQILSHSQTYGRGENRDKTARKVARQLGVSLRPAPD